MKVLTVGASGKFAGLVVPELNRRGATVRALVRNERSGDKARENGASEIAIGDLRYPGTLPAALESVDAVFHIDPAFAPNEAELGIGMVEAAARAGIGKFVFSGVIHPTLSKMVNHAAKQPVEEALFESGLNYVILQPAMFMQTLETAWPQVLSSGRLALPYSKEQKVCYVDYRDVAEAAAIGATTDRLDYGVFELSSPGRYDRIELAAMMSEAAGMDVEASEPSFDEWAQAAHIADGNIRDGMARMYDHYDRFGFPGGNALILEAILQRPPRTLREFVAELAKNRARAELAGAGAPRQ